MIPVEPCEVCPFCGERPFFVDGTHHTTGLQVEYVEHQCKFIGLITITGENAFEKWNTRANQKLIEDLKAENQHFNEELARIVNLIADAKQYIHWGMRAFDCEIYYDDAIRILNKAEEGKV